jgi:hypothetical protein
MERNRRPGKGDGFKDLLGGEPSKPTKNTPKKQRAETAKAFREVRIAGRFVCLEVAHG